MNRSLKIISVAALSMFFLISSNHSYRPIVLVHGIFADKASMQPMVNLIKKYLSPDVYIKNIELGDGFLSSFWNIRKQSEWLAHEIQADPQLRDGFNIIAHSQGGLLARYFIQHYNYPKVFNYIALGTPQAGIFGTPTQIDDVFTWINQLEQEAHQIIYSWFFQRIVSFAGYWRDPLHYDAYLRQCTFLPYLNNEIVHLDAQRYKDNICSLENMVLIKSVVEDIMEPAESCHFGFYHKGSFKLVESLADSDFYKNDDLGIRALDESKRLYLLFAQTPHLRLPSDASNFIENILPFLELTA